MTDPGDLIQRERKRDARTQDELLRTPERLPQSPLMTPFQSNSQTDKNSYIQLRAQDADHQRKFRRFLHNCGIEERPVSQKLVASPALDPSNASTPVANIRFISLPGSGESSTDTLPRLDTPDSPMQADYDTFYDTYAHVFGADDGPEYGEARDASCADSSFRDDYGGSIYIRSNQATLDMLNAVKYNQLATPISIGTEGVPLSSNDTYNNYENRPDDDDDNEEADHVCVEFEKRQCLTFVNAERYKGNLVVCFGDNMIAVAVGSLVSVFSMKTCPPTSTLEMKSAILEFETRPVETTDDQRMRSTWPHYPHTINHMKVATFLGHEVLILAVDDGRILIYNTDVLINEISKIKGTVPPVYTLDANISLEVYSSAWGLDVLDDMILVSDNSQRVTLFFFKYGRFYSVKTHQLLHNIPSVSFIDTTTDHCYASAASISGELIIFDFQFTLDQNGISFKKPVALSRMMLQQSAWNVCFVDGRYFKKVNSMALLTGQDEHLVDKVLTQSLILDTESNPCVSSHLGLAAEFQNLTIKNDWIDDVPKPFTTETDRFRRIRKVYDDYYACKQRGSTKGPPSRNGKRYWEDVAASPQFPLKFLVCTTTEHLGLFRVNHLLYNATAQYVFGHPTVDQRSQHSHRLSLSLVIPDLSLYIVASQLGLVSLFRLTEYRGLYAMRRECVLPEDARDRLDDPVQSLRMQRLVGLTYRQVDDGTYTLYLIYQSGQTFSYTLQDSDTGRTNTLLGYI